MNALEDIGFFCIDNIPASLLIKLMELATKGEAKMQKIAVVLDIRGGRSAEEISKALEPLSNMNISYKILFLDASNEALERRYKETRRRHPISYATGVSVTQAIEQERNILLPLYETANYKIDTSLLSAALLKDKVLSLFVEQNSDAMLLNIMSFGFKYGQPKEADIVFDVRCIPNPFYVPELKPLTGNDKAVYEYVFASDEAKGLIARIEDFVSYTLPLYVKEGKSQLTIAIGCTGGKHRSIAFVNCLAKMCADNGYKPNVEHRDIARFY
ncbi:MAG: RNase adapter RapZ [Oscillospiraceae bacterium]